MFTFNLNDVSSRSKKGETIAQYLLRRKSVDQYLSIMKGIDPTNPIFQKIFNRFYGLNVSAGMNKANFYNVFVAYKGKAEFSYADILKDLANPATGTGRVEKSFASKMLHSLKNDEPIIDSVVIKKLLADPGTKKYFTSKLKPSYTQAEAVQLHNELKNCYYKCLIPMAKRTNFFDDFDIFFPNAAAISNIKKIDFYLWTV